MTLPVLVNTIRMSLPLWTKDDIAQLRGQGRAGNWHADFPRQDDRDAAALWIDGDTWGPRSIVLTGQVVGSIGFFGPPEPGSRERPEAEVGYGLVEDVRGMGMATEALQALLAETDKVGVQVRASVEPDNQGSIRVLMKAGFTEAADPLMMESWSSSDQLCSLRARTATPGRVCRGLLRLGGYPYGVLLVDRSR